VSEGERKRTQCRSCGAPTWWARAAGSSAVELDWEPDPTGNLVVEAGVAVALGGLFAALEGQARWKAHHVTCPKSPPWEEPT
jgi:hypothetical protein